MSKPRTLIIYMSVHHGNTKKLTETIAKVLGAKIVSPSQVRPKDLINFNLVGFGSGIYGFRHHKDLLDFADSLPNMSKKAFIFSTAGFPPMWKKWHIALRDKLTKKGFQIIGEFSCPGWDTFGPLALIGGMYKGRPNEKDLEDARNFAQNLISK